MRYKLKYYTVLITAGVSKIRYSTEIIYKNCALTVCQGRSPPRYLYNNAGLERAKETPRTINCAN